jgi:hypothetical protein
MLTVLSQVRRGNYNPSLLKYHEVTDPWMLSSIFRYFDLEKICMWTLSYLNILSASFKSQMLHTKWTARDLIP